VSTSQRSDDEGRQAWLRGVAADVARLDRSSSAERAADVLRRSITEGALQPGAQLSEIELTEVLEVSRNRSHGRCTSQT
jgi:hypothetical protein